MVTAAFKSNSKRSNGYGGDSPKKTPPNPNPPPQKQRLRRSLSVSAVSPSTQIDIASEFLNKRDNPLFWSTGGSPPADGNTEAPTRIVVAGGGALESKVSRSSNAVVDRRGRSVKRNSDLGSGGQKEEIIGRRRSLSRVNDNGVSNGSHRRGRSVSRAKLAFGVSESETEQELVLSTTYGGRSSFIRPSSSTTSSKLPVSGGKAANMQHDRSRSSHLSRHPSVGSSFDSQVSTWEDGISTGSLSEAEEKTIRAVYEQMKSFEGDKSIEDSASSEIYETVRSEVRRAIADIQDDLQHAIQRNNSVSTEVNDMPPKLVKSGDVELVLDIRRKYAKELEKSQERARKLRSDLAMEEYRKQELSRILKETLPEPKTSVSHSHRSHLGRKSSNERKKMTKRLTDEAMSYFDECVSISTFDSSDFSAAEDPPVNSLHTTSNTCINQTQMIYCDQGSGSTAHSSCNEHVTDRVVETTDNTKWDRKFGFSFGHKPTETMELQQEIKNYIKNFEKEAGIDGIVLERSRSNYSVDRYDLLNLKESLLFDKFLFKNRQESGSLHICGGVAIPFLPFTHLF